MKRREDLDNKDHEFAKWLRGHDFADYTARGTITEYLDSKGAVIATANFDNGACTYTVVTNEV